MPKIEVGENLLNSLLKKPYDAKTLEEQLVVAKGELDDYLPEEKIFKIELNDTNRPDLWSAGGISRLLVSYREDKVPNYNFFSSKEKQQQSGDRVLIVDKSALVVRPYSIGFAVTGEPLTEEILLTLIQSQEKICHNFGQKRKTIAMGVYRSDLIKFPVHYKGADPDEAHFVPLHMEQDLTLREICEKHPKGQEFGHIVADKPLYPLLFDDNGNVLSFPPVINSAYLGAVEENDKNLFFEFSGPILDDLLLAANIVACDCADMGYEILPVLCKFPHETEYGKEVTVPYYFQKPVSCSVPFLQKTLGKKLSEKEIVEALRKMGIEALINSDVVTITVPQYRNDFLHEVDVIEDVMIGHGMGNFEPQMPSDSTIGRLTDSETFARKAKDIMVGLGFQEMMYNYLGSKKEYIDNMLVDGKYYIEIANPMSENYAYVRPSIIPSLLESESVSAHAVYPHQIFEIGKVAFIDESENSGTTTRNCLGFLASAQEMGFNQLNSQVATLFYFLNREYKLKEAVDTRFIEGRCAHIIYNDKEVGIFGEVNPAVLEKWTIGMPTVACEIDLDLIM
ncbi:MAG: phenylalanine--tRNA ligase subunit beta [Sphaerochaetaceae bacterium]